MKLRNQRGSITLFVLVSLLLFIAMVTSAYTFIQGKRGAINNDLKQIKYKYEVSDNELTNLYNSTINFMPTINLNRSQNRINGRIMLNTNNINIRVLKYGWLKSDRNLTKDELSTDKIKEWAFLEKQESDFNIDFIKEDVQVGYYYICFMVNNMEFWKTIEIVPEEDKVYWKLYKINDSEYHLVFNSTGNIAQGYTEEQLKEESGDISNGCGAVKDSNENWISNQGWQPYSDLIKKVKIEDEIKPTRTNCYFYGLSKITEIEGLSNINTINVTSMTSMFDKCSSITSLNLSSFNTANVTTMYCMFYRCSSLTSLNLSSFNTAKVTNMTSMFDQCSSITSLNLSSFNTANVTTMYCMFYRCSSLTSLNLSSFNTANVTTMQAMFDQCSSLTSLDLSSFNTDKVELMKSMFYSCINLKKIYVGNKWKINSITQGDIMFDNCTNLIGAISYDPDKTNAIYANWTTGYLTYKAKSLNEYQNLQYIASSGTQCIDTEVAGNNSNLSFEIQYQWVTLPGSSSYNCVFGSYESENNITTRIIQYGTGKTYFNLNTKAGGSPSYSTTRNTSTIYTETLSSNTNSVTYNSNGTVTNGIKTAGNDSAAHIYLFSGRAGNTSGTSIQVYYFKINNNGTLIRNFVPCKVKVDNTIGIYDSLTGIFYPNKGTGVFTPGSNV